MMLSGHSQLVPPGKEHSPLPSPLIPYSVALWKGGRLTVTEVLIGREDNSYETQQAGTSDSGLQTV